MSDIPEKIRMVGNIRNFYKNSILVGKQQYIIIKPLNIIMLLLSVYILLFYLPEFSWLIQVFFIALSTLLILFEKPKLSFIFHLFTCLWFILLVLQDYGKVPSLFLFGQQINLDYPSLPVSIGIILILAIFGLVFDISLMENLKNTLNVNRISSIEKEKINEYFKKEKNNKNS